MTIRDGLRRMGREMARLAPHDATVQLPGGQGPGIEDEWGQQLPGTAQPGPVLPCYAARLSSEDATRAGLASEREVWRVVIQDPPPDLALSPQSTLTVTLPGGQTVPLAVLRVSGVDRLTLECQRSA